MTLRSDLTTEVEKALREEVYDGGFGALSPEQLTAYVRRLAETAVEVFEEAHDPESSQRRQALIALLHHRFAWDAGASFEEDADAILGLLFPEPQSVVSSDAKVEAAARRLFGATVGSMDRARELARVALTAAPLVACPHWAPGKITFRNGCTACAADAKREGAVADA